MNDEKHAGVITQETLWAVGRLGEAIESFYETCVDADGHAMQVLRLTADPDRHQPLEALLVVCPAAPDAFEYLESCARICERLFDQLKEWQQLERDARANQSH